MPRFARLGPFIGEAPGRLDFMGGVADYSGSLVLETPILGTTRVTIAKGADDKITLWSAEHPSLVTDLTPLATAMHRRVENAAFRQLLQQLQLPDWSHYILGCLFIFSRQKGWVPTEGLEFTIASTVPVSMGVSSSAALEMATLRALAHYADYAYNGTEMARLGQEVENQIVGAPCGIMDQLASAFGRPHHLLPILCRPDILLETIALPESVAVVGWPSGVKHSVAASPYATARTAAFMGKKIFETKSKRSFEYTAEVTPSTYRREAHDLLPESITGQEFLKLYGKPDDPHSRLVPQQVYFPRPAFCFPIEENYRCQLAVALLRDYATPYGRRTLTLLGELLLQSHADYSTIGLGSPETDKMVDAIVALGPDKGFYGARVSGGGSGGTVVVLLEKAALPRLQKLSEQIKFGAKKLPLIM